MKVYKIKQLSTGRFSTGGINPAFTKEGKVWTSKRDLSNHLVQFISEDGKAVVTGKLGYPYDSEYQIVSFELTEVARVSALFELARLAKARYVPESS